MESEITFLKKLFKPIQLGSHISLKKVIHKCQSRCYISSVTVNNICKMFVLEIMFGHFHKIERLKILQLRIPKSSELRIFFITRRRKMCSDTTNST